MPLQRRVCRRQKTPLPCRHWMKNSAISSPVPAQMLVRMPVQAQMSAQVPQLVWPMPLPQGLQRRLAQQQAWLPVLAAVARQAPETVCTPCLPLWLWWHSSPPLCLRTWLAARHPSWPHQPPFAWLLRPWPGLPVVQAAISPAPSRRRARRQSGKQVISYGLLFILRGHHR